MTDLDLSGRVVVVTGAAGRLGRRVVARMLEGGARVAALDRDEDALMQGQATAAAREHVRSYAADATDEAAVRDAFARIREDSGRIDALVHTVGTWAARPLLETSLDEWEGLVRLNLSSAFLCFREAARHMQEQATEEQAERDEPGGAAGRLIGIASGQGADRGAARQGAYSASKAGVIRLVEAAADELEGTGITAHAIAPSMILFGDEDAGQEGVPAAHVARLCAYLCTDAGAALNGATLRAYGTLR